MKKTIFINYHTWQPIKTIHKELTDKELLKELNQLKRDHPEKEVAYLYE